MDSAKKNVQPTGMALARYVSRTVHLPPTLIYNLAFVSAHAMQDTSRILQLQSHPNAYRFAPLATSVILSHSHVVQLAAHLIMLIQSHVSAPKFAHNTTVRICSIPKLLDVSVLLIVAVDFSVIQ